MKKIPPSLLCLGRSSPPETVEIDNDVYRFTLLFKHDFFAATALYQSDRAKVVVKFGRQAPILGIPAEWIGRFLAWHEARMYNALADLESVPRFIGRHGPTAIVHEYIEGQPLSRDADVPDDFFHRLGQAVDMLHERKMAYVDLEKRQNVLLGADGRPYLIDFQISWFLPQRYGGETFPARWLRRRLQEGDRYHLLKLQRRVRRDQLTDEQVRASYQKPFYVRVHRWLTAPLLKIRRALLNRVDPARDDRERGATT